MTPRSSIRVLLVDDDQEDFLLTRSLLDDVGEGHYRIDWTASCEPALAIIRRAEHDVCILDYMLGERDGLDVLKELSAEGSPVPIILLTGSRDHQVERRALELGAADFLRKQDIDPPVLERAIRHALERARTLNELRKSERMWRAVFDRARDAMLVADDDARYRDGNPAALQLLGITRAKLLAMRVHDLSPDVRSELVDASWRAFIAAGSQEGEWRLRSPGGDERIVEFRATASILPGRHLSILRDVTDRRRAEEMTRRLATIVEATDDAIVGTSLDGTVTAWNAGAERLLGYSAREALGTSIFSLGDENCQEAQRRLIERVLAGEPVRNHPAIRRRRDGTSIHVSITASPVLDEAGALVGIATVTRDVTEAREMQARLSMADRMVSVGVLAAGVAHEINNPLAAVIANHDFVAANLDLLEKGDLPEVARADVRESLRDARVAAERVRQIVRDLKIFSHPDDPRREPLDLRPVVESSLRMAWTEIRHRARLVKDFGSAPRVHANEARLGQVVLNLVVNAAQAIGEGEADHNEIRISTRTDERGRAVLEVRDTGCGIVEESLPRLFDPFFTTKPVGVGTGLGLSICARIVNDLGGSITATSSPGNGSVFTVILPPAAADAVAPAPPALASMAAARQGRILVIDDEPAITRSVERILAPEHELTRAHRAEDALELVRSGERYDVILCDLMMPQMTGMDLYAELVATFPDQASNMVFMTGGAFTNRGRAFLDETPNQRIEKPFDTLHLRALINDRVR